MSLLTPARRSTPEYLDDPATDPAALVTSAHDISHCNRLFGGTRALCSELAGIWATLPRTAVLVDVGCGAGDLLVAVRRAAGRAGVTLTIHAVDIRPLFAARAAPHADGAAAASAFALPFADGSADIVTASQFLHHFADDEIGKLAREFSRVARRAVVISDLRRSWAAAAGLWLASWPLRLHPFTRHDGVASVLKGFEPSPFRHLLARATGRDVAVSRRAGFRITASWSVANS